MDGPDAQERKARPEPPVTAAWLERVATHYLDRYGASAEMLRRTLARRVERRCRSRDEAPDPHAALIDETVARAQRAGLVDDARFAAARLRRLRRRGTSSRAAGAKLAQKGVPADIVAAALAEEREEAGLRAQADGSPEPEADIEARAARAYARRRRLGPHRPPETRADQRQRDLAAMARAGFPYRLAVAVIDAEDGEEAFEE